MEVIELYNIDDDDLLKSLASDANYTTGSLYTYESVQEAKDRVNTFLDELPDHSVGNDTLIMGFQAHEESIAKITFAGSREELANITDTESQEFRTKPIPYTFYIDLTGFYGAHEGNLAFFYDNQTSILWPISVEIQKALTARNIRLGFQKPDAPKKQIARRNPKLSDAIIFPCDNMTRHSVRALSCPQEWESAPVAGIYRGITEEYKDLKITVGLPDEKKDKDLGEFLCKHGPQMIKAHFALWARWFIEGENAGPYLKISINQYCEDIGYAKHHGAFKRDHKVQAGKLLQALTSVEMRAEYAVKGSASTRRLRGPIWTRGLIEEEADQYEDLFGQAREGEVALWTPRVFSYAPGQWFSDPVWKEQNKFIGKVSVGLLKLRVDTDQWAILIGGYLATLFRVNHYKPRTLKIGTILRKTGLAQSDDSKRRVKELDGKFNEALNKLAEVGVIDSALPLGADMTEPEWDDPESIAEYAGDSYPAGDWRNRRIVINPPVLFTQDAQRLDKRTETVAKRIENRKQKAIAPK